MVRTRMAFTFVVTGLASGCALTGPNIPPMIGPSELGLSISLTASPDILVQDGLSRARVTLAARDAMGVPVRGLAARVHVDGDDTAADSGRLSRETVTTNDGGEASLTYVAPRATPGTTASATTVVIVFTPIGGNFANATPRSVLIRLVPPSAIP